MLKLYEYLDDMYVERNSLDLQRDVLEYEIIDRVLTSGVSECRLRLKYGLFSDLVGKSRAERDVLRPLLFINETIEDVLYVYFIESRDVIRTKEAVFVELIGYGFDYFKESKILNHTTSYVSVVDPEKPPDDFCKYKYNSTIINHLHKMYDTTYVEPKHMLHGQLSPTTDTRRLFKGFNGYSIELTNNPTVDLQLYYSTVEDFEKILVDKRGVGYVNEVVFDREFGNFTILAREYNELSKNFIKNRTQIIEEIHNNELNVNYVIGTAYPNISVTKSDLRNIDFTSIESHKDFEFIAKDNLNYITAPTTTYLTIKQKDNYINAIQVKITGIWSEFKAGDILPLNNKHYLINQVQETYTKDAYSVDIDIEEVI